MQPRSFLVLIINKLEEFRPIIRYWILFSQCFNQETACHLLDICGCLLAQYTFINRRVCQEKRFCYGKKEYALFTLAFSSFLWMMPVFLRG